ncbi:MAG: phenylalanine--tRNA ligase subunit beta, partial [Chitinophagia bacterium]|nr:phenylalanine--tRNA ligase subunit beta [Chitinophagia bacterium]
MILSYKLLSQCLPLSLPLPDLCTILTSIGLEVEIAETVASTNGNFDGLVVGEVIACEQHPNADKLKITQVKVNGEDAPLQIVCGAANVAVGQKVVVATVGTTLHPTGGEPFTIKKAKIRGAESNGMLCAEDEIGLGTNHDGIMVLDATATIGQPVAKYIAASAEDTAITIGLTPNRGDANSHLGTVIDACTYLNHHRSNGNSYKAIIPPTYKADVTNSQPSFGHESVPECARFCGIKIDNIAAGESPEWLKQILATLGIRSINAIVDITNYVMHELGQPLHAYDANTLNNTTMSVRYAGTDAQFMALDGKTYSLHPTDLMIADGDNKPVGIAGVMGGKGSSVSSTTTSIFLESAHFSPLSIRATSRRLSLRTDAAQRFEKGVDVEQTYMALQRAVYLIQQCYPQAVIGVATDHYTAPYTPPIIETSYSFINNLAGKLYPKEAVDTIMNSLGFTCTPTDVDNFSVAVPARFNDFLHPQDIVEEIIRIDGLDNIPIPGRLSYNLPAAQPANNSYRQEQRIRRLLSGAGAMEIMTNSITNSHLTNPETAVNLLNSLTTELNSMRTSLMPSGTEVLAYNINRKNSNLVLFEFGNVYQKQGEAYTQHRQLGIWATGHIQQAQWNQKEVKTSLHFLKGLVNNITAYLGITAIEYNHVYQDNEPLITATTAHTTLARIYPVPAKLCKQLDIKQDVFYAEVNWEYCLNLIANKKIQFTE